MLQLQQKFYSRDQGKDESLSDYSYILMEIMLVLQERDSRTYADSDAILKERFAEGIRDKSLKRQLKWLNLESSLKFWQLRDRARSWIENGSRATLARSQGVLATSEALHGDFKKALEDQQKQIKELSDSISVLAKGLCRKSSDSATGRGQGKIRFLCHYCKGPNHYARDCFKRKRADESKSGKSQQEKSGQASN